MWLLRKRSRAVYCSLDSAFGSGPFFAQSAQEGFTMAKPTPDALAAHRPKRNKDGRHVVLVGKPPLGWLPRSPADIPEELQGVTVADAGLRLTHAAATVLSFNRRAMVQQIAASGPIDAWGVVGYRASVREDTPCQR